MIYIFDLYKRATSLSYGMIVDHIDRKIWHHFYRVNIYPQKYLMKYDFCLVLFFGN